MIDKIKIPKDAMEAAGIDPILQHTVKIMSHDGNEHDIPPQ